MARRGQDYTRSVNDFAVVRGGVVCAHASMVGRKNSQPLLTRGRFAHYHSVAPANFPKFPLSTEPFPHFPVNFTPALKRHNGGEEHVGY